MIAKLRLVFTITILFVAFWGYSQNNYWAPASSADKDSQDFIRESNLSKSQVFSVDEHALKKTLAGVSSTAKNRIKIYFPDEFGVFKAYYIEEKSVLAPQLAAKYPQIKSYSGYGVEDEKSKIRFSASHNGFQVMMVHPAKPKTTFIQKSSKNNYVVYSRNGLSKKDNDFICSTTATVSNNKNASVQRPVSDQVLRKYRFAVSASGEYTGFHGGEVADALAAINATVTRVNQVFESDLAITLELVANNDEVIFTNGASDPYDDTGNLNAQVQSTLTQFIGEANYDIGHLFHLDANNGNAGFIGAICEDNRKGSAYSSAMEPEGDEFDIDFVAHEIGHQLGANHTWSFESEGTNVQAEPGSGSTIMGYAGITGENNVASKSDDYFHFYSILQIIANVASKSCGEITTLTNNPPVITAGPDYIIPTLTAFTLSADASDPDGDTLTYTWEQIDNGVVTRDTFGPENAAGANFRSRKPTTNPRRYFPSLLNIRSGNLTQTNPTISSGWETATSLDRKLNFAVTVRDNAANAGQVVSDLVQVSVVSSGSAFEVTSQPSGTSYTAGEIQEVSWNVAGTNQAPYDTPTVDILLSLDGGLSFPIVLAEAVLNDGMQEVLIPGNATADARIMVKANENIFFAMNEADFTILESAIVLSPMQTSFEVCQPADASIAFVYETYAGFSEEVTFSAVGLPNGLTATFNPATATANDTQVVLSL